MFQHTSPEPASVLHTAAREGLGFGGTTLWSHAGDGFTVIVYQLHDEPEGGLSIKEDYDMVELRVLSTRTSLKDFWNPKARQVTHKKWSWGLVCMDPDKDYVAIREDMKGMGFRGSYFTFEDYEGLIERAEAYGAKVVDELSKLRRTKMKAHDPWTKALRSEKGGDKDKFWVVAVFPDDFHWVVKVDYGLSNNFGRIYPKHWEIGTIFDDFSRADKYAKGLLHKQYADGFEDDNSPETEKLLRWSLKEAILYSGGTN